MLNNEADAATLATLLITASCANTAAATTVTWIDVRAYEGDLLVIQHVGTITGTLSGKLQSATDSSGTGAADITGATFTQVTTANDAPNLQKIALAKGDVAGGFLGYVGTIGTGPSVVGVHLAGRPKYT